MIALEAQVGHRRCCGGIRRRSRGDRALSEVVARFDDRSCGRRERRDRTVGLVVLDDGRLADEPERARARDEQRALPLGRRRRELAADRASERQRDQPRDGRGARS